MIEQLADTLVAVTACPACAASGREVLDRPCSENKFSAHLRQLGLPLDMVRLVQCQQCRSIYRSPWLTASAMAPIFEDGYASHSEGMEKLATPTYTLEESCIRGGAARFNAFLHARVRPLNRYGEIGCPVWGLLPYYATARYRLLFGALEVPEGARLLGVLAGNIARSRMSVVRALRRMSGMARVPFPGALFWLEHRLQTFWGPACRYLGTSCRNIARPRQLTDVGPDADIPGGPLDVLTMIHVLDHTDDPAGLLRGLAGRTRFLFLWTHGANEGRWTVQHLINFTGVGLQQLARRSGFELVARYPDAGEHDDFGVLLKSTFISERGS